MTIRLERCLLFTFLYSFLTHNLSGALLSRKVYAIYCAINKWRHYFTDAEILLKSDARSLQKFLNGRTDNVKLDQWSLELQGRNIKVEHLPGCKNKAADCLSKLPFVTRKRNNNPLKDKVISINVTQTKENAPCCPICEVDFN